MREINPCTSTGEPLAIARGTGIAPGKMRTGAFILAVSTSLISLAIAVFAGIQRAGSATEQIWSVSMSLVAMLGMLLMPTLWQFVPRRARFVLVG